MLCTYLGDILTKCIIDNFLENENKQIPIYKYKCKYKLGYNSIHKIYNF